ncbi:hypothetical protein GWO43_29295 [candidate division KSB1 bacterium]|nr:hypothetical protein [candidate division KSB1 bacterium]NIR71946.1 hypothetical protein [candidate division KSB1 bacterium]NIS28013.1 hypothetical protein [candidate division KSB1 bacterium]NIT74883.1 hypothetical protein [candidate division KSB1 bacterium]NIU28664.1 hypothetical protein [candidate division KSB1 bacterium]
MFTDKGELSLASTPSHVVAFDLNLDGLLDLATTSGTRPEGSLLINTGKASFELGAKFKTKDISNALVFADLNLDAGSRGNRGKQPWSQFHGPPIAAEQVTVTDQHL